jgi:hypothetical protein
VVKKLDKEKRRTYNEIVIDIQNYSLESNYTLNCGSTLCIAEETGFVVLSVQNRDYVTRDSYLTAECVEVRGKEKTN